MPIRRKIGSSLPLPPGPRGFPLIGNLLDVPKDREWVTYDEWSHKYNSGIIHLEILGASVIVINSRDIAHDLLEKRSLIYSDRPRMPMLNELVGFSWNLAFMPYGKFWKDHRKHFRQEFHPTLLLRRRPKMLDAAHEFLRRLLDEPERFMIHFRHMAGSIILSTAYGIDVRPENDPYIRIAETGLHAMSCSGIKGRYLVDLIPLLKCVPVWCPGAGFRRQAMEWRKSVLAMAEVPFEFVKTSLAEGVATSSVASKLGIDDRGNIGYQEEVIRGVVGTMYTGGSDTTLSVLGSFMLAMVLHPEIQSKAQRAVDDVVGHDRLPDFSDFGSIPYLSAILQEVHRWKAVTPLALPHRLMEDDEYNGFHLPGGSLVIGNIWAMQHDESSYPDASSF